MTTTSQSAKMPVLVGFVAAGRQHVRADLGEQQRVVPARRPSGSTTAGQRVVLDVDELGGVLALVAGVGEHHRDRFADEAHRRRGQQRLPHLVRVHRQWRCLARQVGEVGGGEHRDASGASSAAAVSIATIRACAIGERTKVMRSAPVEPLVDDVLGVDGAGREELRILEPLHPRTEDAAAGEIDTGS